MTPRSLCLLILGAWLLSLCFVDPASAASGPPGFVVENAFPTATFFLPVQVVFVPDGRKLVVEQGGVVWLMTPAGDQLPTPFIDLSAKVLRNGGRGLLGVALDPDFTTNRWVYFAYTVDPDSAGDVEDEAYARLERYQASNVNPNVINLATRQVLIGTDWAHGFPTPDFYHTIGSLRFGADKSLLVSSGEAAHFDATDAGGIDPDQFLPGRANPAEDLGSFRSLTLNSISGKILRLDKETGHGLPSNPYWNGNPVSARSRVWTYGVRNPYRFAIRPGTGQTDPTLADPGVLYIGNTGWNTYETVHLAKVGGLNMGWPCQEGPLPQPSYQAVTQTAAGNTNVLCHAPLSAENPVGPTPPLVWWHHTDGSFSSPSGWTGLATVGGVFHEGTSYPAPYAGGYYVSDYSQGWIRYVKVSSNDQVVGFGNFISGADGPVDVEWDPASGDLFYVSQFNHQVRHIRYALSTQPRSLLVRADSALGDVPPTVPGAASPWVDLARNRDLTLTNFSGTSQSGWQGNGTVPNPYRLVLDGVDDRVTFPGGGMSELQSPTTATLAMWIRTGPDVFRSQYLFEWVEQYSAPYAGMTMDITAGLLQVYLDSWTNVATVRPNTWYHVALVKGPGSVRVLLDGTLIHASTIPYLGGQVSDLVFGASARQGPGSYGNFFRGSIALAGVWPAALSDGEILALYQQSSSLFFPPGPKIAVFRADSVSGGLPAPVPSALSPWKDLVATHDADLFGFAGTAGSGWQGAGDLNSPYRLVFDGVDDRVTISAGSVNELQSPAGYSAGLWVRTGPDVLTQQYLIDWRDPYAANAPGMTMAIQNGSFRVFLNPWVDVAAVVPNTWYHFAVAKDASGARVYVDGLRRATVVAPLIGSQSSEIVLGASTFRGPGVYGEPFRGAIAQFTVWGRGLIDPEMQEAYSHDQALYSGPPLIGAKVAQFRADSADGSAHYPIPGATGPWTDVVSSHDASLQSFSGNAASGWQGVGTIASPYRLVFDGVNDLVTIPAGSIPELQSPTEATVTLLFQTGSDVTSLQYLLEWLQSYAAPFAGMSLAIQNGQFRLVLGSWVDVFSIQPDTWYHFTVVKDPIAAVAYVNGQFVFSTGSPNLGGQVSELVFGASIRGGPGNYASFFGGSIAGVSIWPRALAASAVRAIYESDSTGFFLPPVLGAEEGVASARLSARPNPFSRSLSVEFTLPRAGRVELAVYAVDGRRVRTLFSGSRAAGTHSLVWDGTDGAGRRAEPGVYFVRVDAPDLHLARRIAFVR